MLSKLSRVEAVEAGETAGVINLRFTYKSASIAILEKVTFKEPREILKEALEFSGECVVLQTCNRVEIYAAAPESCLSEAAARIAERWRLKSKLGEEEFYRRLERSFNLEALTHLLRLASGLESMVVGEDQILGQVQEAFEEAKKCGAVGPTLEAAFERAVKTGRRVRFETKINKGAVSIGSAAVELLEETLGDLGSKKIMIIGAGKTGCLVGKALASKGHAAIFVANRTYERGVRLARTLGGRAVRFDKVKALLANVDVAIAATSAPHYVLTESLLREALKKRAGKGKIFIMDLSQPRNVEEGVANLPGVELRDIDDLRGIAKKNLETRLKEIKEAEAIIEEELERLNSTLKRKRAEPVISALCNKVEEVRRKELEKALRMLGEINDKQRKVVDDLTLVLVKRILHGPILNLREAASKGDMGAILAAQRLFGLDPPKEGEMSGVPQSSNEEAS